MSDATTSYRVRVPAEKDRGARHPEVLVGARSPEEAKRRAWTFMTWPTNIRAASELEAIEAFLPSPADRMGRRGP